MEPMAIGALVLLRFFPLNPFYVFLTAFSS